MAYYMLQIAYSADAWATQVKDPQNRLELVRPVVETLGGTIHGAWLSFGEYDGLIICLIPDHLSQAAFAMAATAAGHLKAAKTTPLMTVEEGIEAMGKAGAVIYPAPSN